MDRREMLKILPALAGGAMLSPVGFAFPQSTNATPRIPLGLQFGAPKLDSDQNLAALNDVAKMGYEMVEFAGLGFSQPDVVRKQAQSAGLQLHSVHIGNDQVQSFMGRMPGAAPAARGPAGAAGAGAPANGANNAQAGRGAAPPSGNRGGGGGIDGALDATFTPQGMLQISRIMLPRVRDLGVEWAVMASFGPSCFASVDALKRACDALNKSNDMAKAVGLKMGFHTEEVAAQQVEGRLGLDVFFENVDPSIGLQLDIGHVAAAGADPLALMNKYRSRIFSMHLRDIDKNGRTVGAGDGVFDWKAIRAAGDKIPNLLYYAEGGDPTHVYKNLQVFGWGKA